MTKPLNFYRFALSGHAHRVELMLSLLGLPCERIDVDLGAGEQKLPAFLARNAFGQVPVIEDGDFTLADSNAILVYLALTRDPERRWLPEDPRIQANVQRWLSVAAGQLAQGPAAARISHVFGKPFDPRSATIAQALFDVMEKRLNSGPWLAAEHPTLADVAMYSYTAHAPEGGISLGDWPAVSAWVRRVEALPGFVGMARSALPAAA